MEEATDTKTQSPPVVENAAEKGTGAETKEPTVDELKQAVLALTETGGKSQQEVKRLQGILKNQGVTKRDIEALRQEFGGMADWVAGALDKSNEGGAGEFEKPKVSYAEQLAANRKTTATALENQPLSEDQQMFYGYMISQGLTIESPEVKEALTDNRDFQEAREHLKGSIAGKSETARKADITAAVQEAMKVGGLSQGGAGAPTTGSTGFTRESIAKMSDEDLIANQEAINRAMTEGKIK